MTLPIFRLGALDQPGEQARLTSACESLGFFYIADHAIDPALERQLERDSAAFFARPLADKQQIAMARGGATWRGYFPVGGELTSGVPDIKEVLRRRAGARRSAGDRRVADARRELAPDEPAGLRTRATDVPATR